MKFSFLFVILKLFQLKRQRVRVLAGSVFMLLLLVLLLIGVTRVRLTIVLPLFLLFPLPSFRLSKILLIRRTRALWSGRSKFLMILSLGKRIGRFIRRNLMAETRGQKFKLIFVKFKLILLKFVLLPLTIQRLRRVLGVMVFIPKPVMVKNWHGFLPLLTRFLLTRMKSRLSVLLSKRQKGWTRPVLILILES